MATGTATDHRTVVDTCHRRPATGAVATLTAVAGLDMVGCFTDGCAAVMAAGAIAAGIGMIELGRCPVAGVMAGLAGAAARNMFSRLAGSGGPVVATGAVTRNLTVIETCRRPARSRMAGLAVASAGDVLG